jgi:hypothetical protein
MPITARNFALTRSQAACLTALRNGKNSKSKVALEAELDLIETVTALAALGQLGLPDKTKQAERGARLLAGKCAVTRLFRIVRAEIGERQAPAVCGSLHCWTGQCGGEISQKN